MKIITVGTDKYIVCRELGDSQERATIIRDCTGGVLIRNGNTNRFMICTKIGDAEYEDSQNDA